MSARVCPTNLTVPEIHANAAVLEELKSSLLTQRVLEAAVERAVAILCVSPMTTVDSSWSPGSW